MLSCQTQRSYTFFEDTENLVLLGCYATSSGNFLRPFRYNLDGFGGLVVSVLATGSRVRGVRTRPKPLDFFCVKNPRTPSFGGKVK
jgi:hypothetical protein